MSQFRPAGFTILPSVVKYLLIINGLMFLITLAAEGLFQLNLTNYLGLHYFGAENFKSFQVVTHLFMHGSIMHLMMNMFALWMFGSALENIWGPKRFLIYYVFTGLGAAVLHSFVTVYNIYDLEQIVIAYIHAPSFEAFNQIWNDYGMIAPSWKDAWNHNPYAREYIDQSIRHLNMLLEFQKNIPTVGASGAVFGLLLAFGMLFPNTTLFLIFVPIPIKAKYFVFLYGGFELLRGVQNNPGDNVAHFAHLGGMLFGYILLKYWQRGRKTFF